jgi:hypothetical protein
MHRTAFAAAAAMLLIAACASPPRNERGVEISGPEASIPFADQRASIRNWQADGIHGIWVEDAHGNWYYGRFHSPCIGLDLAMTVAFRTGGTSQLDRFSTVLVPGEGRCPLVSFVATTEPPDNGRRRKGGDAAAE